MFQKIPIIDAHTDLVLAYQDLKDGFAKQLSNTQTSLPLLKQSNVKVVFAGYSYDDYFSDSEQQFQNIHRMLEAHRGELEHIQDFNQLGHLLASEKTGVIIHLEGAKILNGSIEKLVQLHQEGLRSLGLTHNTKNGLGTGAAVDDGSGLTKFGREVIKKSNELGIILDLAHLNEAGFCDVIKISKKPVIVSHANCYAITPHPRNLKDSQIKEIGIQDSFIGICFAGKFLHPQQQPDKATVDDVIAHLEHVIEVAGIGHVGIGSDFGGITTGVANGLANHLAVARLFEELSKRGYKSEDLEKIAYKNALRVLTKYS